MSICRATSADYAYWLNKELWLKSEAALLFSELEPDSVRKSENWDPEAFPDLGDVSFQREGEVFASFFRLFESDPQFEGAELCDIAPMAWVNWANARGLAIPAELIRAAEARNTPTPDRARDAQTRYATAEDSKQLEIFARDFKNTVGHGPSRNEMYEKFAKPSKLSRNWLREQIPKLPDEVRRPSGRKK